jgi:hypothetical protein
MKRRSWVLGALVGLLVGLLVSIPMTVADWLLNPADIFRDDEGTDWVVVAETLTSWFWPFALVALVTTLTVHSWVTRGLTK